MSRSMKRSVFWTSARKTAFDDTMLLQASQQYEAEQEAERILEEEDSVDDTILLQASQQYEAEHGEQQVIVKPPDDLHVAHKATNVVPCSSKQRFGDPVTESDILAKINSAIPRSTRKTTLWSVNTWRE